MNQLFTHTVLIGGLVSLFFCCNTQQPCPELAGRWANREGQVFMFQPNGSAQWLVKFGSQYDTFPMEYRYDCGKKPAELDLTGFQSGPLTGKTLYGILEWTSDSSFRFDAEPGASPELRPATFNIEQTMKFYKER